MVDEKAYIEEVKLAIEQVKLSGCSSRGINTIVKDCDSFDELLNYVNVDPNLMNNLCKELDLKFPITQSSDIKEKRKLARRLSADFQTKIPAPNPLLSQWWFTLNTTSLLAERVWGLANEGPAAFLGTPTIGMHYAISYGKATTILDTDLDLIKLIDELKAKFKLENLNCEEYNVKDNLSKLKRKYVLNHNVVLIDPPWYPSDIELFIYRAKMLLKEEGGYILCVIPPRLTRPGIIEERSTLIKRLLNWNFEIVALDLAFVKYRTPEFEKKAFQKIDDFTGRIWRNGDLLVLRAKDIKSDMDEDQNIKDIIEKQKAQPKIISFQNKKKKNLNKRYFLYENKQNPDLKSCFIEVISDFEDNVSTRKYNEEELMLWSSDKKGVQIKNYELSKKILDNWQEGKTKEQTRDKLQNISRIEDILDEFENFLELWGGEETSFRRTDEKLEELRIEYINKIIASEKPDREDRPYPDKFKDDGFRTSYQRDRDRILWAHSLKRLANKTQLFPVESDDHLRRRLTHSIEVMQIASTIAESFGLDKYLTEAGSLAHDLGHTPFGHAGEKALKEIIEKVTEGKLSFNHYEHGVDIVRWLEDVYQSPGTDECPGLNLTNQTMECIFKHTYDIEEQKQNYNISKHKFFTRDSYCHLEGQAVRIADKISYLISDLEDGIRMGIIKLDDIRDCRFFERPPIDIVLTNKDEKLFDRFISQRRSILKVIMEDVLNSTEKRLITLKKDNNDELDSIKIRNAGKYIIDYSESLKKEIEEIWNKLQSGKMHKHWKVKSRNAKAMRIVKQLFLFFMTNPALTDETFRNSHKKLKKEPDYFDYYISQFATEIEGNKTSIGIDKSLLENHIRDEQPIKESANYIIPIYSIILAKDFVASLTDTQASKLYNDYITSL